MSGVLGDELLELLAGLGKQADALGSIRVAGGHVEADLGLLQRQVGSVFGVLAEALFEVLQGKVSHAAVAELLDEGHLRVLRLILGRRGARDGEQAEKDGKKSMSKHG